MKRVTFVRGAMFALGVVIVAPAARAEDAAPSPVATPDAAPPPRLYLELPLVDLPFQAANGGALPSMQQSLWVTNDLYQGAHRLLGLLQDPYGATFREKLFGRALSVAFDTMTWALPGFLAWEHEEWHRAVMSWRDIGSFDDVYHYQGLFPNLINVSHVKDEDLIRLKAEHPADQVRLQTAGIEAVYEGAAALEKAQFFHGSRVWIPYLLLLHNIFNSGYLSSCASSSSDQDTRDEQMKLGTNVAARDFAGLDCDGWTYDLFRPDEPYAARGIEPSGVGIDRYRTYSQLTPEEQRFMRLQYHLSLLNFADPNLLGLDRFRWPWLVGGEPLDFNLALRYRPAAFGYDLRLDVFLQRAQRQNLFVSLHGYFNRTGPWPGLEAELIRFPGRSLFGQPVVLGARLALWLQPERLRYDASGVDPGGLASVRVGWGRDAAFEPYVEVEAKTAGWVAGNVFLDANVSGRLGLASRF